MKSPIFSSGRRVEEVVPIEVGEPVELGDPAAHEVDPPAEVELEAAVGVGDLALPAAGRRGRDHAGQVRGQFGRRRPLEPAHVAETGRADLAGAPGLAGDPLDHVVAVPAVVDHRPPFALGLAAPADVDGDEGVAVPLVEAAFVGDEPTRFVVGRHRNDGRGGAVCLGGEIDIGCQLDPVPHRDAHFADGHRVVRASRQGRDRAVVRGLTQGLVHGIPPEHIDESVAASSPEAEARANREAAGRGGPGAFPRRRGRQLERAPGPPLRLAGAVGQPRHGENAPGQNLFGQVQRGPILGAVPTDAGAGRGRFARRQVDEVDVLVAGADVGELDVRRGGRADAAARGRRPRSRARPAASPGRRSPPKPRAARPRPAVRSARCGHPAATSGPAGGDGAGAPARRGRRTRRR